jgi:hypothetical protein
MNNPWKTMQTEDYVQATNEAVNANDKDFPCQRSDRRKAVSPHCFTEFLDSNQREQYRNPEWMTLTSSEHSSERENSGFSV